MKQSLNFEFYAQAPSVWVSTEPQKALIFLFLGQAAMHYHQRLVSAKTCLSSRLLMFPRTFQPSTPEHKTPGLYWLLLFYIGLSSILEFLIMMSASIDFLDHIPAQRAPEGQTSNLVNPPSKAQALSIIDTVFVSLILLAVLVRVFVCTKLAKVWGWDDGELVHFSVR